MSNLEIYQSALNNSANIIGNRHLYVASIVKSLFNPADYKTICEIGGGNLELAEALTDIYNSVTEYEPYPTSMVKKPNLTLYKRGFAGNETLTSDAYVSVCPYINSYNSEETEISYYEKESRNQLKEQIIKKLIQANKDFLVISSKGMDTFAQEIATEYNGLITIADIDLHEFRYGSKKITQHKVLIHKK